MSSDTGLPFELRANIERATAGQVLRQLGVMVVIVAVWTGLLVGFVRLTGEPVDTVVADTPPFATVVPSPAETLPPSSDTAMPETSPSPSPEVAGPVTQPTASFSQDVLPTFESRCFQCHSASRTEGGLALHNHQAVLAGSGDGPVIEPGDADGSLLVQVIVSGEMPRRGPNLLPAEIETIIEWVNAGAPDN